MSPLHRKLPPKLHGRDHYQETTTWPQELGQELQLMQLLVVVAGVADGVAVVAMVVVAVVVAAAVAAVIKFGVPRLPLLRQQELP